MNKGSAIIAMISGSIVEIVSKPWQLKYFDERFYERYDNGPWDISNLNVFSDGLEYRIIKN